MSALLEIAALVVFILASVLAFATTATADTVLGWIAIGLAAWVASAVAPANLP